MSALAGTGIIAGVAGAPDSSRAQSAERNRSQNRATAIARQVQDTAELHRGQMQTTDSDQELPDSLPPGYEQLWANRPDSAETDATPVQTADRKLPDEPAHRIDLTA
ncbi:MAG: hypothetical protein AAF612_09405 [Planctomycetota bacterium]